MTNLDKFAAALRAATPTPDADAKATALRMATENFNRLQEQAKPARPTPQAPKMGFLWKGLTTMFKPSSLRPALYATSCLIIAGTVFTVYKPWNGNLPTLSDAATTETSNLATSSEATASTFAVPKDSDAMARVEKPRAAKPAPAIEQMAGAAELAPKTERRAKIAQSSGVASNLDSISSLATIVPAPSPADIAASQPALNHDQFATESENPLKITAETPVSTFSIDVDTAAYAYVRASILNGERLNPDAIRIEEMVNYFTYTYPAPDISKAPFSTQITVTKTPWNPNTQLVQIGIQGAKPALENRPPLNLVFLIDTSGSMQDPNKLPLLKQSFRLMLSELRPTDQVAIVTYAGSAGTALEPTPASNTAKILASLENLNAGGATAGQAGLEQAYALAEQMKSDGEISRVLLATDGDFNLGINDPDTLKTFIAQKRDTGTYLSVLGFGRGNYRDDMMQTLAQNGNGTASYIDTLSEAQKVLVDQLSGALFPIANDVKIQVEFNPAAVAEYRLIGYETRVLNREDFNNDKVDAGDIGAGHQVTALYEITPTGSPALLNDPLRYTAQAAGEKTGELGIFKLRYKSPGTSESQRLTTPIRATTTPSDAGFATAIAGFAQLLKGSNYTKNWSFDDAITLATATKGPDPFGYRAEAIRLMKLAKSQR
jgi:Ca-activated chloride channel family protein